MGNGLSRESVYTSISDELQTGRVATASRRRFVHGRIVNECTVGRVPFARQTSPLGAVSLYNWVEESIWVAGRDKLFPTFVGGPRGTSRASAKTLFRSMFPGVSARLRHLHASDASS
jgi:hypothetical protein